MSPLSIALFTYSTKPRGSVVHAAQLAEALGALGHAPTLYALDKDGAGFFRSLRVPYVAIPAAPAPPAAAGSDALIAQRIRELERFVSHARLHHDVVHAEDCLVASGLIAARASLRGALLCRTVHHVEAFESPFLGACQERSIRAAELVLSVSRATAADVRRCYARRSQVVANGVELARFDGAPGAAADAMALRARYAIPSAAPLLVSVGGVEPRKNSLMMLRAFVRARAQLPALHWLIVGGASIFEHAAYRAAFDAELAALPPRLQAAVIRVGVLDDAAMPALYAASDVLLHAALQEGFGLCVLEAMAAGLPVVVSRGGPFDEYLDATCALQVDPHDASAIASSIVTALRADRAMLEAARVRAATFSWSRSAARHVALYRQALAVRRRRARKGERSASHA